MVPTCHSKPIITVSKIENCHRKILKIGGARLYGPSPVQYIQLMQMGYESYTPDQILALVQWHMQVVPYPWEPPAFYVRLTAS